MVDNTTVTKRAVEALKSKYDSVYETVIHKSVEAAKSSESGIALCKLKHKLGAKYISLSREMGGK